MVGYKAQGFVYFSKIFQKEDNESRIIKRIS